MKLLDFTVDERWSNGWSWCLQMIFIGPENHNEHMVSWLKCSYYETWLIQNGMFEWVLRGKLIRIGLMRLVYPQILVKGKTVVGNISGLNTYEVSCKAPWRACLLNFNVLLTVGAATDATKPTADHKSAAVMLCMKWNCLVLYCVITLITVILLVKVLYAVADIGLSILENSTVTGANRGSNPRTQAHADQWSPVQLVVSGRYRPGKDKPDPKTWKANFRCALNSLPDICELHEHSRKRGNNAYRVYRMMPSKQSQRRRKGNTCV